MPIERKVTYVCEVCEQSAEAIDWQETPEGIVDIPEGFVTLNAARVVTNPEWLEWGEQATKERAMLINAAVAQGVEEAEASVAYPIPENPLPANIVQGLEATFCSECSKRLQGSLFMDDWEAA